MNGGKLNAGEHILLVSPMIDVLLILEQVQGRVAKQMLGVVIMRAATFGLDPKVESL